MATQRMKENTPIVPRMMCNNKTNSKISFPKDSIFS